MLKSIWRYCGSVRVTFWLLLLISLNLAGGSYYIKYYPQIFRPLNSFLFQDWVRIYWQEYPDKIWWLCMLLGLLAALGINIFACTTDRLYSLFSLRREMSFKEFIFKITPSLIHICFLIILSGHLLSLVDGFSSDVSIKTEAKNTYFIQPNIRLINRECDFYGSPEMLKGYLKQCTVSLELQTKEEMRVKQISFLKPVFWEGLSFHLTMDKKAKTPALKISMKRDPGLKFILLGFTILVLLMLWYFLTLQKNTKDIL